MTLVGHHAWFKLSLSETRLFIPNTEPRRDKTVPPLDPPMGDRSRPLLVAAVLLLLLLPTPALAHNEVVELTHIRVIEMRDIGIEESELSPDASDVLLVGLEGWAHLLDAVDPNVEVELNSNDEDDLRDVDWHPRGNTALIVGDSGTMLRYAREDHSITHVSGSAGSLYGQDLSDVSWDGPGNWAYLGGPGGLLMRYRENGTTGEGEFHALDGSRSSDITAIDCHSVMHSHCAVSTRSDGIALIDVNHTVHWLPTSDGTDWADVICPNAQLNRCVAVGRDQTVGVVLLDVNDAGNTEFHSKRVETTGQFTGVQVRDENSLLLTTAPLGYVDWLLEDGSDQLGQAYPWIDNDHVGDEGALMLLRNQRIIGGWSDTSETGFGITSFGTVFHYAPPSDPLSDKLSSAIAPLLVIVAVPGVVLGLIYMSSPKLQKWYMDRRKAKHQAKVDAAKAAEKERAGRKKRG